MDSMTLYTAALATLGLCNAPGMLLQNPAPPFRSSSADVRPTTRHTIQAIKICPLYYKQTASHFTVT